MTQQAKITQQAPDWSHTDCTECEGHGAFHRQDRWGFLEPEDCENCHGTGEVLAKWLCGGCDTELDDLKPDPITGEPVAFCPSCDEDGPLYAMPA